MPAVKHSKRAEFIRSLSTSVRHLRAHPYPVLVSALVSLCFVERLVVDQVVFGMFSGVYVSAISTTAILMFVLGWFFVLLCLVLDRRTMEKRLRQIGIVLKRVFEETLSPRTLVIAALVLLVGALVPAVGSKESIGATLGKWFERLREAAHELRPALELVGSIGVGYGIWYVIYKYLEPKTRTVEQAINETIASCVFIFASSAESVGRSPSKLRGSGL